MRLNRFAAGLVGTVVAAGIVGLAMAGDDQSASGSEASVSDRSLDRLDPESEQGRVSICPCSSPGVGAGLWSKSFWNDGFSVRGALTSEDMIRLVDADMRTLTVRTPGSPRPATCEISDGNAQVDVPLNPATRQLEACRAELLAFAERDGVTVPGS